MKRFEYAALDAVNWSSLKHMGDSPLHYRHRLTEEREDTDALLLGRAVHTACLEPDRFPVEYAVWTGGRRAGKEWDAFVASHVGRDILREQDYDEVCRIRDAVRRHPLAAPYLLAPGPCEHVVQWTDAETGLRCKSRQDKRAAIGGGVLVDLKTARDIRDRLFGSAAARLGYHAQMAFYFDGLAASGAGVEKVVLLAVESKAPYDAAVYVCTEDVLWAGREEYQRLLAMLVRCRETDTWPGRYTEEMELVLPQWLFETDDDAEADAGLIHEET